MRIEVTDDIRARARAVRSVDDLAAVLTDIAACNGGEGVTRQKLRYWSRIDQDEVYMRFAEGGRLRDTRYHHFDIPKKSGGVRHIAAPARALKRLLRYVNAFLGCLFTPSAYATGFVEGCSVVDNAQRHLGANYVFNTDLRDFFPSVTRKMVYDRLLREPFGFDKGLAALLSNLCCMRVFDADGALHYILPQGAPTSPTITNMICDRLDERLAGLAEAYGATYSRYADDMTFSSNHNLFDPKGSFLKKMQKVIASYGFALNADKTRLARRGRRQEVTGLVLSPEKVNVARRYMRQLRSTLYVWERYGYAVAVRTFVYGKRRSPGKRLENILYGQLQWVRLVRGDEDPVYQALQARLEACLEACADQLEPDEEGMAYPETLTVPDFEAKHRCHLQLKRVASGREGEFRLAGFFRLHGTDVPVRVHESACTLPLDVMQVTLCIHPDRGYSWVLHRPHRLAEG